MIWVIVRLSPSNNGGLLDQCTVFYRKMTLNQSSFQHVTAPSLSLCLRTFALAVPCALTTSHTSSQVAPFLSFQVSAPSEKLSLINFLTLGLSDFQSDYLMLFSAEHLSPSDIFFFISLVLYCLSPSLSSMKTETVCVLFTIRVSNT